MKPLYLLDTNMISEIFKPFPNKNAYEKLIDDIQASYNIIHYDSSRYTKSLKGKRKAVRFSKHANCFDCDFKLYDFSKS